MYIYPGKHSTTELRPQVLFKLLFGTWYYYVAQTGLEPTLQDQKVLNLWSFFLILSAVITGLCHQAPFHFCSLSYCSREHNITCTSGLSFLGFLGNCKKVGPPWAQSSQYTDMQSVLVSCSCIKGIFHYVRRAFRNLPSTRTMWGCLKATLTNIQKQAAKVHTDRRD